MNASTDKPLLVVGAGIAGVTAALEAAEAGRQVVLVEREPSVGGRVLRAYHYFPKMCPPACGMEINTQRLEKNPRVTVKVDTELKAASKGSGGWQVTLATKPKYVNDRCTACGECSKVCPAKIANPHNLGIDEVPVIRLAHDAAWPKRFTLNREACPDGCDECVKACKYEAIDLAAEGTEESVDVGAVLLATGWRPYPLDKLPEFGAGAIKNVIANVNMERMRAPNGPTGGKIQRPSDGEAPKKIAFVQCAGSRDVNHLPYCSAICCLASLKQAIYVREQLPECEVTIYYIDRRTPGRNEDVLTKVAAMDGVSLVKGKVGKIEEQEGGNLVLKVEDVESGKLLDAEADLVVLATGMVPNLSDGDMPLEFKQDEDGFGLDDLDAGVVVAGVARRPEDVASSVRDATGAAAKAIVAAGRGA
ncbi:MAG: CoB--CoM heterodisulfide reductase iron-sulfur subunit A family protein [Deltaproteobacteria bacterium]|jgi:quinone-modifying oxidoreductase subunit QmoA|nr:CoB--CoM heterodisulfide reductase iron-sulfur subunit A family protein [Deltaproteobacteria bacterium]MBW2531375.1 CoB--CoM heterodisulfide reductase iron-sulfur subunit A family protein [Deltaproteobacteria bacterium]